MSLYSFLKSRTRKTVALKYGRDVIRDLVVKAVHSKKGGLDILDIGCAGCRDLFNIRNAIPDREVRLHGVDFRPKEFYNVQEAVDFRVCNIEQEPLPFADETMDVIVCNQIFEHCKEIFFMTSEIARVLRSGGVAIIGVPNLSSLHSLAMIAVGKQPPPIFVVGPHVRGFCANGLSELFEFAGTFRHLETRGSGFYPFPVPIAKILAMVFPIYSVSLFGLFEKVGEAGNYLESLQRIEVESGFKGWTL